MPTETWCPGIGAALADYTRPELIVPQLLASDPAGIIEELSRRLGAHEIMGDVLAFYHAAITHDFLANSALPGGLAIPHARSSQVRRLTLVVGRTSGPVVWGARRSFLVEHVFLLAVPATEATTCLALLSSLASLSLQPAFLARLRAATDAEGIFQLLREIHVQPG